MDLLELYKNEQKLTIENNKVLLMPIDKYSFTSFPLPEDKSSCIKVTKDEYFGILLGRFMFSEDLKSVVDYIPQMEPSAE